MSGVMQKYTYFYVDSQSLNIVITEWVDDSDSQSENEPVQRSPNKPKETKIKPVMLCAHGSYKDSFDACFVDLGCLEKHNFSTALLQNSRNHHGIKQFSVNSQKASCFLLLHLGSFPDWLSSSDGSVEQFQSCNICNYNKTDCYYK